MVPERNCLVVSTYNSDRRPWNGVCYEFANVIAAIEDAHLAAPAGTAHFGHTPPQSWELRHELKHRLASRVRHIFGGRYSPRMKTEALTEDFDVSFYMCQFVQEIQEIEQIKGWRERSRFAAIFILESWSSTFDKYRNEIRLLDKFDHVFVLNGSCIEKLRQYTSTPITQLSTAADCIQSAPIPHQPHRCFDISCFGRRDAVTHEKLMDHAHRNSLFYHHDVWNNILAEDWQRIRQMNADIIKRSRFYLVWDPKTANPKMRSRIGDDEALSTRYFEGTAGGAILLGTVPQCPEFTAAFDWPDAVIPLGDDPVAVFKMLDAAPDWCRSIRNTNIFNSLRRHDWAHRWTEVIAQAGLEPSFAHLSRLRRLELMAAQIRPGTVNNLERRAI